MTGSEVVHSVLDLAIGSGVLYALFAKGARKRKAILATEPSPTHAANLHNIGIFKGESLVGWRPEGHPDIEVALHTPGLAVRWPDGSIQEKP